LWTTSADQLVSIDPATGAGTVVGQFNTPLSGMRTLAFDIVTGKLYGMDGAPAAALYEIDPQTAAVTQVGSARTANIGGLGADLAGNLYGTNEPTGEIFKLDKTTGAATLVATLPGLRISDLAFRPEDGQLFAITQGNTVPNPNSLYVIDANWNATRVGPLDPANSGLAMNGLAFGPGIFVPEPATLLLMVVVGGALLSRKRSKRQ
jgi:hypothetical protein